MQCGDGGETENKKQKQKKYIMPNDEPASNSYTHVAKRNEGPRGPRGRGPRPIGKAKRQRRQNQMQGRQKARAQGKKGKKKTRRTREAEAERRWGQKKQGCKPVAPVA